MTDRDCANCKHHTEDGCSSWDCEYEPKDLISRADAIEAVLTYFIPRTHTGDRGEHEEDFVRTIFNALPSAETHEIRTETHGVCLISKDDAMGAVQDHFNADGFKGYDDGQKMMDRIKALPSADAKTKRVLQGYCKGADCKWWNPQIKGCNRCVMIQDEYTHISADAVQGEWIHDGQNFKGGLDWCHCSVCGQKTSTNGLSMYNFCPNCGAIMYKGGDDE